MRLATKVSMILAGGASAATLAAAGPAAAGLATAKPPTAKPAAATPCGTIPAGSQCAATWENDRGLLFGGTLNRGHNYMYCAAWWTDVYDYSGNHRGYEVRQGPYYNGWWLWTDMDTGGSDWVSAIGLTGPGNGNDQAVDVYRHPFRPCFSTNAKTRAFAQLPKVAHERATEG